MFLIVAEDLTNYFKKYGNVVTVTNYARSQQMSISMIWICDFFHSEKTIKEILTLGKTHEFDGKEVSIVLLCFIFAFPYKLAQYLVLLLSS